MKQLKLAVLAGDGIGQDVTHAAVPLFSLLGLPIELVFGDMGLECWKQEGNPIPKKTWDIIHSCDAILLGGTTNMPEKEALQALPEHLHASPPTYVSPIVQLRQQLDLYLNVRPCFNIKNGIEDFKFSIIREHTEGLYSGLDFYPLSSALRSVISTHSQWRHVSEDNASCSVRLQTRHGLQRLFDYAFSYADREAFSRVTFADKPNVLHKSSAFAREIFEDVAHQYPHIQADIHNVDAVARWMVKHPQKLGVIVAENMFGDILSDVGAGVMGGLSFASSANIGVKGCYFAPVHGSAPRIKANRANPSAMFLTIGLLLKHFGFHAESNQIQQAVHAVVMEEKQVTYDLGGDASTQTMSKAIIDRYLEPRVRKTISFLATGNEMIQGEVQDANNHFFSKSITEKGGNIYQHMQVSDRKKEISSALKYLLSQSDAVIVTGGLGPTSDDATRFAVSDVIKQALHFDEAAWTHVVNRLNRFNISVTDSNRQQALFPPDSERYENEHGTACGCFITWKNRYIFMLPGPPKECHPMFYNYVIPALDKLNFFQFKKIRRWLTLGLIEGEIAQRIDDITKATVAEIGYRWNYPYLEIKMTTEDKENVNQIAMDIENMLSPYLVSCDGKNAFETLAESMQRVSEMISIIDEVTDGEFEQAISLGQLNYLRVKHENVKGLWLHVKSSQPLHHQTEFSGSIALECDGFMDAKHIYSHRISIANRGQEIIDFAKIYMAWQIQKFITSHRS